MKKTLLSICLTFLSVVLLQAQKLDSATLASPQKLHDYYWQKHNRTVTTGRVLLITGLACLPLGYYLLGQGFSDYPSVEVGPAVTIGVIAYGILAPLVSIPFFIEAGDNKRKARLVLKGQAIMMGSKMLNKSTYPSLTVSIPL